MHIESRHLLRFPTKRLKFSQKDGKSPTKSRNFNEQKVAAFAPDHIPLVGKAMTATVKPAPEHKDQDTVKATHKHRLLGAVKSRPSAPAKQSVVTSFVDLTVETDETYHKAQLTQPRPQVYSSKCARAPKRIGGKDQRAAHAAPWI